MVHVAGGVVWNKDRGVAIVAQPNDTWSLPKGHVERGETHLEAAIREIEEETGIPSEALQFIKPLGAYKRDRIKKHPNDPDEERTITMFLFTTTAEHLMPKDPENPEAYWCAIEEVEQRLTHPKDVEFFASIKTTLDRQ